MMNEQKNFVQRPKKQKQELEKIVLYLGELPPDIDQFELHQFIMSHGKFNVESLIVKPTKENKSYAYVKFGNENEVSKAKEALHLKTLKNYVVKAEPFNKKIEKKSEENTDSSKNLFVRNLPAETTPKDLYDLFNKFGTIISIKLKQNKKGECLGYGYVKYENSNSAEEAMTSLNKQQFRGKNLHVSFFSSKKERTTGEKFPLVLIKQLPPSITTEKQLEAIFAPFGQIVFCGLVGAGSKFNSSENNTTESEKISDKMGVVLFRNKEEASESVISLNETIIDDSNVAMQLILAPINKETLEKLWKAKQQSYKNKYEGCNLVIKNIPKEISEKNLYEIFKQFGDIVSARIATEGKMKEIRNDTGLVIDKEFVYESKGYGFVLFKNSDDAANAKNSLNFTPYEFQGHLLKLAVEFYDYSKAEKGHKNPIKSNMQGGGKQMGQGRGNFNPNYNRGSPNKRKFRGGRNIQRGDRGQINNDENISNNNMVINNRTVIQPRDNRDNKVNF